MSEWISVEDRLPNKDAHYLVVINNGVDVINIVTSLKFSGNNFWDSIGFPPVTHWMPLPKPPE